jgi:carboxyl-terminal processing protease
MLKFIEKPVLGYLSGLALMLILLSSCSDDQEIRPEADSGNFPDIGVNAVNIPAWIYDEMSFFYYWNESLPNQAPAGDEEPETYFNSLLYASDKFSYISDDAESIKEEISGTIFAMGFSPSFGVFTNSRNIFAVVEYVYPNSPAAIAGLKRGDIILKINGEDLNNNNFQNLNSNKGFTVTLGSYTGTSIRQTNSVITIGTGIIDLDPVIHYEVKEIDGISIGYLVYIDFISGENDKWLKSLETALLDMQQKNIREMVLDLRYNPGGEVDVATYLASALAPASAVNQKEILVNFQYNDALQKFFTDRQGANSPNLSARFSNQGVNLNLDNLYVLTTGGTASASELVINGLRPYMNVVMIGEPTFGKFYGSFVLFDQNDPPKHNWAIAPVVLKYANADGVTDFVNGLFPDIFILDNLLAAKPFGDLSDPMLAAALNIIAGGDFSSSRRSIERNYTPIYDISKINRKNAFVVGF